MPTLLLKAKKLKALACVLGVLFSVIIVLTVLHAVSTKFARSLSRMAESLTPQFRQIPQHST